MYLFCVWFFFFQRRLMNNFAMIKLWLVVFEGNVNQHWLTKCMKKARKHRKNTPQSRATNLKKNNNNNQNMSQLNDINCAQIISKLMHKICLVRKFSWYSIKVEKVIYLQLYLCTCIWSCRSSRVGTLYVLCIRPQINETQIDFYS